MTMAVLFRWLHVLAAILAVGAVLYQRIAVLPAIAECLDAASQAKVRDRLAARWRVPLMVAIAALLGSGLYNFVTVSLPKARSAPSYHMLFGIKFVLALVVFFLASALVGRSPRFAAMRADGRKWAGVTAVLAVAIVLLSGILKNL